MFFLRQFKVPELDHRDPRKLSNKNPPVEFRSEMLIQELKTQIRSLVRPWDDRFVSRVSFAQIL